MSIMMSYQTPQQREQEFAPLLFALTPADIALATPRSATPQRGGGESMSAQRRSVTSGSVQTEVTPQATPPPVSRLDDVTMEDVSNAGRPAASPGILALAVQPPASRSVAPQYEDVWVTVYGFQPSSVPTILKEFGQCGDLLQWGTFGQPQGNFIHIQFQNKYAAQRALLRDGEQLTANLIVGVKPVEARHRSAIAEYNSMKQQEALQILRPSLQAERPYRLDHSIASQQIPLPKRTLASKVAEFVFGF